MPTYCSSLTWLRPGPSPDMPISSASWVLSDIGDWGETHQTFAGVRTDRAFVHSHEGGTGDEVVDTDDRAARLRL